MLVGLGGRVERKGSSELVEASAVRLFTFQAARVFLCPTDARVLDSLASDHRMVVVQAR